MGFFSRTFEPISTKLHTKYPWVLGMYNLLWMKGPTLFRGEIITRKYLDEIFKKSSSPKPPGQFQSYLAQSILGYREFNFLQLRTTHFSKMRKFDFSLIISIIIAFIDWNCFLGELCCPWASCYLSQCETSWYEYNYVICHLGKYLK